MTSGVFTDVAPDLAGVLDELRRREPVFHTAEFGGTAQDWERTMSPDYWEVGASGRRYSRAFLLRHLSEHPPADADSASWRSYDFALRRLGPDTYLCTYTLRQGDRLTRRATIWDRAAEGWRILYHQGTVVSAEEDDTSPEA
jgi:hypothetical protein